MHLTPFFGPPKKINARIRYTNVLQLKNQQTSNIKRGNYNSTEEAGDCLSKKLLRSYLAE